MIPLTAKKRSELRAEAHALSPLIIIGDKGLTDEVLAEIDRTLRAHELIKVRAATDDRDARSAWIEAICERLQAHPVQQIGKVFVVYRENPEDKPVKRSGPGPSPRRGARDDMKARSGARDTVKARSGARDDVKGRGGAWKDKGKPRTGIRGKTGVERGGEGQASGARGGKLWSKSRDESDVKRTSHPRSRTPSPRPASAPRRRRPRTSQ